MINGIFFFTQGGVQQIGEIMSLDLIIKTMRQVLPELEQQQRKLVFDTLTTEEIADLIKERESLTNTGKTEKLKR